MVSHVQDSETTNNARPYGQLTHRVGLGGRPVGH